MSNPPLIRRVESLRDVYPGDDGYDPVDQFAKRHDVFAEAGGFADVEPEARADLAVVAWELHMATMAYYEARAGVNEGTIDQEAAPSEDDLLGLMRNALYAVVADPQMRDNIHAREAMTTAEGQA